MGGKYSRKSKIDTTERHRFNLPAASVRRERIVGKVGNNPTGYSDFFNGSCESGELRSPSIRLRLTPRTGLETVNKYNISMNKSELSIPSTLENIQLVENFIEIITEKYHLSEKLLGKVTLSVIEAVNNAILSGNKENPQKAVKLTAICNARSVIITVEDEGEGFDFSKIPDPTTPKRFMKESGRGLYLMSKLTDELIFDKNGAKVIMSFTLNPL